MSLFSLAWKNLTYRPVSVLMSFILLSVSTATLWLAGEIERQSNEKLEKNLAGIDLVVGAKGSPLQLILSSVYHMDDPTGNITQKEARFITRHPLVKRAIPLAYGDNFRGFRIVGTNHEYAALYQLELLEGKLWKDDMEVCIGAAIALQFGLKTGDTIQGSHGSDENEEAHGTYRVCGIFKPSGTVPDQLLLTNISSVWQVHETHADGHTHHDDDHLAHHEDHPHEDSGEDKEITALLVEYRSPLAAVQLPRQINLQGRLQAASPAIEMTRLYHLLNLGSDGIRWLGKSLILLAGLSIFLHLLKNIQERREELLLLRHLGYSRLKLLTLLFLENLFWILPAWLCGELLARRLLHFIGNSLNYGNVYQFDSGNWTIADGQLLLLGLALSLLSLIWPALVIFRMKISDLLK